MRVKLANLAKDLEKTYKNLLIQTNKIPWGPFIHTITLAALPLVFVPFIFNEATFGQAMNLVTLLFGVYLLASGLTHKVVIDWLRLKFGL